MTRYTDVAKTLFEAGIITTPETFWPTHINPEIAARLRGEMEYPSAATGAAPADVDPQIISDAFISAGVRKVVRYVDVTRIETGAGAAILADAAVGRWPEELPGWVVPCDGVARPPGTVICDHER